MSKVALEKTKGSYSEAVQRGQLVFVSGQVATDANGNVVSKDVEEQTRHIFAKIGRLMEKAGGGINDIVKITIYLTDLSYYPAVARVRSEVFREPYPASVAVVVASLLKPEWLIEIDAVGIV